MGKGLKLKNFMVDLEKHNKILKLLEICVCICGWVPCVGAYIWVFVVGALKAEF